MQRKQNKERERKRKRKGKFCCLTQKRVTVFYIRWICITAHRGGKKAWKSATVRKPLQSESSWPVWYWGQIFVANAEALHQALYPALPGALEKPQEKDGRGRRWGSPVCTSLSASRQDRATSNTVQPSATREWTEHKRCPQLYGQHCLRSIYWMAYCVLLEPSTRCWEKHKGYRS